MTRQHSILIVDDEDPLRMSLSLILQKENYRVDTAANAEAALGCLQLQNYDLMFLDLNMPGRDGIDLLLEVHERFPQMPVLILTAHAALESAIQALRLEAKDYLLKPVEPVTLLSRVEQILTQQEQPARKKEIVDEMQNLLAELQKLDGERLTRTDTSPSADPDRFLSKGPFKLDLLERHATLRGEYIAVNGIYFDYLVTLLRHAPKAVGYKTLVKESQRYDASFVEARDMARWRIHELRKAIEKDIGQPQYLLTVRGTGYRLAV
jgi:DNA-binding response OmpR family regulator